MRVLYRFAQVRHWKEQLQGLESCTFIRLFLHWWQPSLVLLCDLLVDIAIQHYEAVLWI